MAGTETGAPNPLPLVEQDDPFATMNGTLAGILEALTGRDKDETQWDLTGVGNVGSILQSQHLRFRSELLVFSATALAVITLTIGTRTYTFNVGGADTKVLPFVVVLERGTDVSLTASAGNVTGYLIGTRE